MTDFALPPLVAAARVASVQGGVLTTAQARAAGLTSAQIRTLVRSGRWMRSRRGVLAPDPDPDEHGALAATCHVVAGAVVSHESAALLHGLELLRWTASGPTFTVQKRPRTTPALLDGATILRADLPPAHVTVTPTGIPVTAVARTAVDLARTRELRDGLVVVDSALRRGASKAELEEVLLVQRGWPGTRSARTAIRLGDVRRESPLESFAAAVWCERGLPPSVPQVWIYDERGFVGRVDEHWAEHQTVGEADGLVKYTGGEAFRAEKVRHERLVNAGLEVVRYTSRDLWRDPVLTAQRVKEAFARGDRLTPRFLASPTELSPEAWWRGWYARYGVIPRG